MSEIDMSVVERLRQFLESELVHAQWISVV